jgi:hypothetical protein
MYFQRWILRYSEQARDDAEYFEDWSGNRVQGCFDSRFQSP